MKTLLVVLTAICIYVLSLSVYGGWTGHGLIVTKTWLLANALIIFSAFATLIFCVYQFVRKNGEARRQWLLQTTILTASWAVTLIVIMIGSGLAVKSGRYCYWKSHKSELELIALEVLKLHQADGCYYVPPHEVSQIDYPIFVDRDSTNGFQAVGFSHYSTTPGRRSGFIVLKEPNRLALNALRGHADGLIQLDTNWFEYGHYKMTNP